jgi:probable HAF family extracellular repeat protein
MLATTRVSVLIGFGLLLDLPHNRKSERLMKIVLSVLVSFAVLESAVVAAEVRYSVVDLGTPAGKTMSSATGINDNGQIVGYSGDYGTGLGTGVVINSHAFVYDGGAMQDLGIAPNGFDGGAFGVNNSVVVVGGPSARTLLNGHAFTVNNGIKSDLGTLGGSQSAACGINDAGLVVGWAFNLSGRQRAFSYDGTILHDLGTIPSGDFSQAFAVNQSGQVVGRAGSTTGIWWHAFIYNGGQMQDIGTLGGSISQANAINNRGQVVGSADTGSREDAFIYENGSMTDLGTLAAPYNVESSALGIGDNGDIVGASFAPGDNFGMHSSAFLVTGGTMLDLNTLISPTSGWHLSTATAINRNGLIVGQGINPDGQTDAFLLFPVPEPSTLWLALIGVTLIACSLIARRRRRLWSLI